MVRTGCECEIPTDGKRSMFCQRHGCKKYRQDVKNCQNYWDYFRAYEEGMGARQQPKQDPGEPPKPVPLGEGPGTELIVVLGWLWIKSIPGCGCKKMARLMNRWGPDGCRQPKRMKAILDKMEIEAKKRKLPFVRPAAKRLVGIAIRRAEKKQKKSQAA